MTASSAELIRAEVEARILVVDDEPEIAELLGDSLRQADPAWDIVVETDPANALQRIEHERFDCLVTDLVMPDMGGLSLAEHARAADQGLSLIAVTGCGTLETSIEALRLGFADFIEKPFNLETIQGAVSRTLQRRRRQENRDDRFAELTRANQELKTANTQTSQKLEIASHDLVLSGKRMARQFEEVLVAADVAKSLMGIIELEDLLGLCAEVAGDRVPCESATVALYEPHENAVGLMVRARPESEDPPALCWLRTPITSGAMCRAAQANRSIHVEDLQQSALSHEQEREFWHNGRLLVVPIPFHSTAVAVAVLHRGTGDEDFSAYDIKHVTGLAALMGPAIRTAKLHHRQRCQIYASLETIADAAEGRDPYLAGHSARVLQYAMPVAIALQLPQSHVGALQIAARLHDIGRIIIPESAVSHPGPLSEQQWEIVREHPRAGAEFLKALDFFGEVGAVILAHHESYDGTGYPHRKAGDEIPLVARLIAVADAFDAMTSDRPYRDALSIDQARDQIGSLAGQQFDPQVAEAFLAVPPDLLREIQASARPLGD